MSSSMFYFTGGKMKKDIIKIVLSCIIAYPLVLLCIHLEGPKSENNWLIALVIAIIVCSCFIIKIIKDGEL